MEGEEMKELFISDLLQTLTHQHFCSAMQKLRIPTQAAVSVTFTSFIRGFLQCLYNTSPFP